MSGLGRILILGATGQVGRELQRSFAGAGELFLSDTEMADVRSPESLRDAVRRAAPDVILNAAAYTAVDRAETEPDDAFAINAAAPRVLAEEAVRSNALLVHYSTDYVFDGSKPEPWEETDTPNPLNVYGASKLAGERAVQETGGKYLIFRTSWVYGPHGNNFLLTMLRLGRERDQLRIVDDQIGAPTTSIELADATRSIVTGALNRQFGPDESWIGLYHMSCAGFTSWCGFAREIFARGASLLNGSLPEIIAIRSEEYLTAAKRPTNSVLSNKRLKSRFGVALPPWESALSKTLVLLNGQAASHTR
ncbi:MAG: dTDP-4-dehydrorhamnose reductase [Terracidiphilus sp.]